MAYCEHLSSSDRDRALVDAAADGHHDCVESLLNAGASVNPSAEKIEKNGNTALIKAAAKGRVKCVKLLIDTGADVNGSNAYDKTAIRCAAEYDHEECLKLLINAGADVNVSAVNALKKYRTTALIVAAVKGNVRCVDLLLKAGADVNGINNDGETALKCAASRGQIECMRQLLQAGADVNNSNEITERFLSRNEEDTELSDRFKSHPHAQYTALMCSAYRGHSSCVEVLIEAGADVNICTEKHETALSLATGWDNNYDIVSLLLNAGADVNKGEISGKTSLNFIVSNGYEDYLELFLKAGADVNRRDEQQRTVLHVATERCHYECVNKLINAGAEVNAVAEDDITPLMSAITGPTGRGIHLVDRIKCVQSLLKSGARVNMRTTCGQNALDRYLATQTEVNKEIAMLLFAAGEKSGGPSISGECRIRPSYLKIPDFLLEERKIKVGLKGLCRKVIRKHLMKLDLNQNLFQRVPLLDLPSMVSEYLLYDTTLDVECNGSGGEIL